MSQTTRDHLAIAECYYILLFLWKCLCHLITVPSNFSNIWAPCCLSSAIQVQASIWFTFSPLGKIIDYTIILSWNQTSFFPPFVGNSVIFLSAYFPNTCYISYLLLYKYVPTESNLKRRRGDGYQCSNSWSNYSSLVVTRMTKKSVILRF